MTQEKALSLMLSGSNIFLTGPPGSGKIYLLNEYIRAAKDKGLRVAITATTGIAATPLNGTTIHSWAGIGLKEIFSRQEIDNISKNYKLVSRYKYANVLVIDEISMLDRMRLDLINQLAKILRHNDKPMGGLQIILVGDLFQLPPVSTISNPYVFNCQTWKELDLKVCYLSEQHRQSTGDELNEILGAIRSNRISQTELNVLNSKVSSTNNSRRNILKLYAHNFEADELNEQNLNGLKTKGKLYKMKTKGPKTEVKNLKEAILSPETLRLKIGCEVIFTANNYKIGFVNGDRGRVVDFKGSYPVVRMMRRAYLTVDQHKWQREVDGRVIAQAWQLPLKLAWAITIHKSQGMSLDEAQIDLSKSFSPGMGYVALSRLRNIDGLYLTGLNKMALYVDGNISKIDKILRAESLKLM